MSLSIAGFPSLYIQGVGALRELPRALDAVAREGGLAAVLDPFVVPMFQTIDAGRPMEILPFGGECTAREIDRLTAALAATGRSFGAVLGAGGGKALDTAKAVAHGLGLPVLIAPTVASSDAPTSRIAAVYDDHHRIVSVPRLRRNPDAVIVDTEVIRRAPARFFAAGIGDALTKHHEVAESVAAGNANFFDAQPTGLALLLARECETTLKRDGLAALEAVREGRDDPAIGRVVEATVLYSGLAFEGGGLSIAHGLLRGLTARAETQAVLHGELVAYGLLVQRLAADAPPAEIAELRAFLRSLGLPVRLADIGLAGIDAEDIRRIADQTFEAAYVASQKVSRSLTPSGLAAAIEAAEAL